MATGTLLPIPRLYGIDAGIALPGAKLSVFSAGTSTPVDTYSDVNLTTPNANPVVADADGLFGPIYIPAISVKVVLKDSADATIYTQDNVAAVGLTALQAVSNSVADGRLTVVSADPVGSGSSAVIKYTPFIGNRIALYDGTTWVIRTFAEVSLAIPTTANTNHDIWAYDNAGTVTLESTAWSTAHARVTAITRQDGVYVKSGTATRRYLGTVRINASNTIPDTDTERFVWNVQNRVRKRLRVTDTTDNWTYTTATVRQARASTANQVGLVCGLTESLVELIVRAHASNATAGVDVAVGIGEDSTAIIEPGCVGIRGQTNVVDRLIAVVAELRKFPLAIGYTFFAWLEYSTATGTTTWYGDGGSTTLTSGLHGSVDV